MSTKGYAFEVLELLAEGHIVNYASEWVLREYQGKLTSKKALKYLSPEEAEGISIS
ncbi:hypothetical protein QDY65_01145 [Pyrococcus kukulkanii]|uniref:hypothetical protein n=1 Tax=Pyrococcus kukulkanii TaxID=1609559 RepID=UPI003562B66A